MVFITDKQELKTGLIIFRRSDVKHKNWYCRIKIPHEDRYKTVSLETADINTAKDKAFEQDADVRFRVKHAVPVFEKSFAEVAAEYVEHLKGLVASDQITEKRYKCVEGYVQLHLNAYAGSEQIAYMNEEKWRGYFLWRKENGEGRGGGKPKDTTVRHEMRAFLAVLNFAVSKRYLRWEQVPRGKILPGEDGRREEFTPKEYRHLHTFARSWVRQARSELAKWYRTVTYNYILIMSNTGMRTMEARNLRWRDIDVRTDREGREFACINVRGKKKFRELVAPRSVADYFERIRAISPATKPDDFVFTTIKGKRPARLYTLPIADLLKQAKLRQSASGSVRSAYCFRHTYATFRLMEGIDSIFLAKQMGTSVRMIEKHYGHITPTKNAERILHGIPGWDAIDSPSASPPPRGVNAAVSRPRKAAKPAGKK